MRVIKEYEEPKGCNGCVYAGLRAITILLILVLIWYVNKY